MKKNIMIACLIVIVGSQLAMITMVAHHIGKMDSWMNDMYEEVLSIDSRLDFIEWKMKGK